MPAISAAVLSSAGTRALEQPARPWQQHPCPLLAEYLLRLPLAVHLLLHALASCSFPLASVAFSLLLAPAASSRPLAAQMKMNHWLRIRQPPASALRVPPSAQGTFSSEAQVLLLRWAVPWTKAFCTIQVRA